MSCSLYKHRLMTKYQFTRTKIKLFKIFNDNSWFGHAPLGHKPFTGLGHLSKNHTILIIHTLSRRTGSALVWHTRGRVFEPRLVQQVLWFVDRLNTEQYMELMGYCPWGWRCDQSIWSTVSVAIVRSWLLSTATRSSPFGYFSILLQVVDNWPNIMW